MSLTGSETLSRLFPVCGSSTGVVIDSIFVVWSLFKLFCRYSTICPSVRISTSSSAGISSSSGALSCTAPRISTRLIESIPRSDSISIPSSSISCGYPVFSLTTDIMICITFPAESPEAAEDGEIVSGATVSVIISVTGTGGEVDWSAVVSKAAV